MPEMNVEFVLIFHHNSVRKLINVFAVSIWELLACRRLVVHHHESLGMSKNVSLISSMFACDENIGETANISIKEKFSMDSS